jgi:hypothetical protein
MGVARRGHRFMPDYGIFSNDPKITEGHLIFFIFLDCVVIVMCGITIVLSVIE